MIERKKIEFDDPIPLIRPQEPVTLFESMRPETLYGYIVGANQRMGIPNEENFQTYLYNLRSDIPLLGKRDFSAVWQRLLVLTREPVSGRVKKISRIHSKYIDYKEDRKLKSAKKEGELLVLSCFLEHDEEEFLTPLQESSLASYFAASTSFDWTRDPKKLSQLAEDVSLINTAYQEMGNLKFPKLS